MNQETQTDMTNICATDLLEHDLPRSVGVCLLAQVLQLCGGERLPDVAQHVLQLSRGDEALALPIKHLPGALQVRFVVKVLDVS